MNYILNDELIGMSMAFTYWYARLSAFHARIVKVRDTAPIHLADEMVGRLNARINTIEQYISINKKKMEDVRVYCAEKVNDITVMYTSLINNM